MKSYKVKALLAGVGTVFACGTALNADGASVYNQHETSNQSQQCKSENSKKWKFGIEAGVSGRLDYIKIKAKKDTANKLKEIDYQIAKIQMSNEEYNAWNTVVNDADLDADEKTKLKKIMDEVLKIWKEGVVKGSEPAVSAYTKQKNELFELFEIDDKSVNDKKTVYDLLNNRASIYLDLCKVNEVTRNPSSGFDEKIRGSHSPVDIINEEFKKGSDNIITSNLEGSVSSWDYVNFDIFGGFFASYNISNSVYLLAGIGGTYDLAGSDGLSFEGRAGKKEKSSGNKSNNKSGFTKYKLKYSIDAKLGIGFQVSKRIGLELGVMDKITNVEYNCADVYDSSDLNGTVLRTLRTLNSKITSYIPDKKQSNFVHRIGFSLGLVAKVTDHFSIKLDCFYMMPTNIFKKIQPLDVTIQSAGASLSVRYTF